MRPLWCTSQHYRIAGSSHHLGFLMRQSTKLLHWSLFVFQSIDKTYALSNINSIRASFPVLPWRSFSLKKTVGYTLKSEFCGFMMALEMTEVKTLEPQKYWTHEDWIDVSWKPQQQNEPWASVAVVGFSRLPLPSVEDMHICTEISTWNIPKKVLSFSLRWLKSKSSAFFSNHHRLLAWVTDSTSH